MPATPTRIGFISEEWRRATAETPATKTLFGNLARESDDPVETFLDSTTDAQAIADERQALLSAPRRRFTLAIAGVSDMLDIALGTAVPVATYVDTEKDANQKVIVAEVAIDLSRENASAIVWG